MYGVSISHTTRKPRFGEENGVHYHFVSRADMEKMNEQNKFISLVSLFGNLYGTSIESVEKVTEEGKVCVLDLEYEALSFVKKSYIKPRYIFITTPSIAVLEQRLTRRLARTQMSDPVDSIQANYGESSANSRESTNAEDVNHWLDKAQKIKANIGYDFAVENNDLEKAYKELRDYCLSVCWNDLDD